MLNNLLNRWQIKLREAVEIYDARYSRYVPYRLRIVLGFLWRGLAWGMYLGSVLGFILGLPLIPFGPIFGVIYGLEIGIIYGLVFSILMSGISLSVFSTSNDPKRYLRMGRVLSLTSSFPIYLIFFAWQYPFPLYSLQWVLADVYGIIAHLIAATILPLWTYEKIIEWYLDSSINNEHLTPSRFA